jgi:hypothetical protein
VFDELRSAIATIEVVLHDLEPRTVDGAGAVTLVELFTSVEHLGAAGTAIAGRRVHETGVYRDSGARSAGHWLAKQTGTTVGAAIRALDTAKALRDLTATDQAFRAGELSDAQAHEITAAATIDPESEARLLRTAKRTNLKGLKDAARTVHACARDDAEWAQNLHDTRSVSTWTERDGAVRADVRLAPDRGGEFLAALCAETDLIFREARAAGCREPRAAYMADALANLVANGPRRKTSATLIADESAITRGHIIDGERCEIAGVGPIPVTIARAMLSDANVRTSTVAGLEIEGIDSDSRYLPADLRRWLDATYTSCGVEGCDVDHGLEYDHVVPYAQGGPTTRDNLWRLCRYHHRLKTNERWRVTGTAHQWGLAPPEGASVGPDPPS